MKKRHIAALSLSLACSLTVGFALGNLQPQTAAADTQKVYANMFTYDESQVTLTDYSAAAQAKGVDVGKTGLYLKSVKSGVEAEGTTITYDGVLSGAFSMDFRVFSEETYQGAYPFIAGNTTGNIFTDANYKGAAIGTAGAGAHVTYSAGSSGTNRWTYQEDDAFNPYQDLKQVNIVFTSNTNPNVKFSVNVYGSQSQSSFAPQASVRVAIPGSTWARGYGEKADKAGVANDNWNLDLATEIDSTFTNSMYNKDTNNPVNIQFDPATMTVFTETGGTRQNIRTLTNNDFWSQSVDSSVTRAGYYGTIPAGSFDDGYTVSIVFADVTANTQTIDHTVPAAKGWSNSNVPYGSLYAEDGTTLKTYDRYANMVIYSMNGVSFEKPEKSVTTQTTAVTTDKGVTLDAGKFENGGKAIHLTTDKTGVNAIGTTFAVNNAFTGNFETDFRVYSQKSYTPLDPTAPRTHNNDYGSFGKNDIASVMDDQNNPYLDLKEVAFTFTSKTDSSVWFKLFVRGGGAQEGVADQVSFRVLTSTDKRDWVPSKNGTSVGTKGNNKWANYVGYHGATFSNTLVPDATSDSVNVGFDITTGIAYYVNASGKQVEIRNVYSNDSLMGLGMDWAVNGTSGSKIFPLATTAFANGYSVSIEFTDVTSDDFVGGLDTSKYSYKDLSYGYAPITQAYKRTPNMLVYGMKDGATALELNSLIKQEKTTPTVKATVNGETTVGSTLTVVPVVNDPKAGALTYTGAITWKNLDNNTTGVAENGSFVAATPGTYAITVGAMAETANTNATATFTMNVKVTGYNVVLKSDTGVVLATKAVAPGASYTLENVANATANTFLGWKYSGGLYPVGYTITPDSDVEIVAESIQFAMTDGASIRAEETAGHSYGLRFQANVDKDKLAALGATVVSAKGNILPADMIENGVWSDQALVINLDLTDGSDTFVITSIYLSNFNRKFAARAYLEIAYADGSVGKVYTAYDEAKNAFAVNYIAKKALEAAAENPNRYTADEIKVFNGYVNSVIELTYDAQMNLTSNNPTVYTVETVSFEGGVLTAKVTFAANAYYFYDFGAELVRLAVTAYDAQGNAMRLVRPTFISYADGVLTASVVVA